MIRHTAAFTTLSSALVATLLAAPGARLLGAEGKLDEVRHETHGSGSTDHSSSNHSSSSTTSSSSSSFGSSSSSSDDDDVGSELLGVMVVGVGYVMIQPIMLPRHALGDDHAASPPLTHQPYPDPADARAPTVPWLSGHADIETAYDGENLHRYSAHLQLDTSTRLGLAAVWDRYYEHLDGSWDRLDTGDAELTICFARGAVGSMRTGFGVRWLREPGHSDFGFNWTYGGEFVPVRPLTIAAQIEAGTLGKAGVFRGRATIGGAWRQGELYAGYNYLAIGGAELHGPLAGFGWWF